MHIPLLVYQLTMGGLRLVIQKLKLLKIESNNKLILRVLKLKKNGVGLQSMTMALEKPFQITISMHFLPRMK